MRVPTHFGVTITGSRSVRYRSISNEADPPQMITAACSAGRRHATAEQDVLRLRSRAQLRWLAAAMAGNDAAQIHDALDPGGHGGIREDSRRIAVPLPERRGGAQGMNEVIGHIDAARACRTAVLSSASGYRDLDVGGPGPVGASRGREPCTGRATPRRAAQGLAARRCTQTPR
jgi:hypothetical protein